MQYHDNDKHVRDEGGGGSSSGNNVGGGSGGGAGGYASSTTTSTTTTSTASAAAAITRKPKAFGIGNSKGLLKAFQPPTQPPLAQAPVPVVVVVVVDRPTKGLTILILRPNRLKTFFCYGQH